jgi:hypothetical protein
VSLSGNRHIVLRFRDLVTEPGGTIAEHRRVLDLHRTVWWGWWMRQYEEPPRQLLGEVRDLLDQGTEPTAYLLDSGGAQLYSCTISDLRVGPPGETLASPDVNRTPEYYQRGRYPAWFLLAGIEEDSLDGKSWHFHRFPTNPDKAANEEREGEAIQSVEQIRDTDATLWVVEDRA